MGSLGQWTYPNGSVILRNGGGQQFYSIRNTIQVIRLARRETTNPLTPTGSYYCTVPTTLGEITFCANLGEWSLVHGFTGQSSLFVSASVPSTSV